MEIKKGALQSCPGLSNRRAVTTTAAAVTTAVVVRCGERSLRSESRENNIRRVSASCLLAACVIASQSECRSPSKRLPARCRTELQVRDTHTPEHCSFISHIAINLSKKLARCFE